MRCLSNTRTWCLAVQTRPPWVWGLRPSGTWSQTTGCKRSRQRHYWPWVAHQKRMDFSLRFPTSLEVRYGLGQESGATYYFYAAEQECWILLLWLMAILGIRNWFVSPIVDAVPQHKWQFHRPQCTREPRKTGFLKKHGTWANKRYW